MVLIIGLAIKHEVSHSSIAALRLAMYPLVENLNFQDLDSLTDSERASFSTSSAWWQAEWKLLNAQVGNVQEKSSDQCTKAHHLQDRFVAVLSLLTFLNWTQCLPKSKNFLDLEDIQPFLDTLSLAVQLKSKRTEISLCLALMKNARITPLAERAILKVLHELSNRDPVIHFHSLLSTTRSADSSQQ